MTNAKNIDVVGLLADLQAAIIALGQDLNIEKIERRELNKRMQKVEVVLLRIQDNIKGMV